MALTPEARQTFTRLFGTEPTPHPSDPELYEILQNQIFGEVFATGVLTDGERELLTVTVLAAMQTLPQLAAHVRAALNVGVAPLEVREAIYQCAPYIGYPKALNAVATADEVLTAEGVALPLPGAGGRRWPRAPPPAPPAGSRVRRRGRARSARAVGPARRAARRRPGRGCRWCRGQ